MKLNYLIVAEFIEKYILNIKRFINLVYYLLHVIWKIFFVKQILIYFNFSVTSFLLGTSFFIIIGLISIDLIALLLILFWVLLNDPSLCFCLPILATYIEFCGIFFLINFLDQIFSLCGICVILEQSWIKYEQRFTCHNLYTLFRNLNTSLSQVVLLFFLGLFSLSNFPPISPLLI